MLPILYKDDHLVAVHKPPGLLVHRTILDTRGRRFALQMVREQIGERVYVVHRLDRATALSGLFARQEVSKTYLAVVRGHPPEAGEIDHPLTRQPDDLEWAPPGGVGGPQA